MKRDKNTGIRDTAIGWAILLCVLVVLYKFPFIMGIVVALSLLVLTFVWVRQQLYFHRNAGKILLVVDGRHGWRELINNNLIPVVPQDVDQVWFDAELSCRIKMVPLVDCVEQRPYIALITRRGLKVASLHKSLLPFKSCGRRDDMVQEKLKPILLGEIERLRALHGYAKITV